jgi:hypothetical protein
MGGMRFMHIWLALVLCTAGFAAPAIAQQDPGSAPPATDQGGTQLPDIPTTEEVLREQQATLPPYTPLQMSFRIGIIGNHEVQIETTVGLQRQVKNPLILFDPANGNPNVYAKNFPARIVAVAPNGSWVVGVVPSASVEHSSGSSNKECAVSLNLVRDEIKLIAEFPLHSNFQALFAPDNNDTLYYCINEPGAVNAIIKYGLSDQKSEAIPADGNRFYMYGMRFAAPRGIWIQDPKSSAGDPALQLVDVVKGNSLASVDLPGAHDIYVRPGGESLLAAVLSGAEASVGYYMLADKSFHQVPQLVLTRPSFRWTHNSVAVIAKESTSTRDRFLWIDLNTGQVRELFSGFFKVDYWDISPKDEALVFITNAKNAPVLFVVPLDPQLNIVNRIQLKDVTNISWLGCLNPPPSGSRGSWLERLLPF